MVRRLQAVGLGPLVQVRHYTEGNDHKEVRKPSQKR